MLRGAVAAGVLILAMGSELRADSEQGQAHHMSCSDVRYYVEKYSAEVAEMYARSYGATDAQIDRARRCLMSSHLRKAERWRIYTR